MSSWNEHREINKEYIDQRDIHSPNVKQFKIFYFTVSRLLSTAVVFSKIAIKLFPTATNDEKCRIMLSINHTWPETNSYVW